MVTSLQYIENLKILVNFSSKKAVIAQLGERQTEDLKVPGSIPGRGIFFFPISLPTGYSVIKALILASINPKLDMKK